MSSSLCCYAGYAICLELTSDLSLHSLSPRSLIDVTDTASAALLLATLGEKSLVLECEFTACFDLPQDAETLTCERTY